jgi:hypothetical protein
MSIVSLYSSAIFRHERISQGAPGGRAKVTLVEGRSGRHLKKNKESETSVILDANISFHIHSTFCVKISK